MRIIIVRHGDPNYELDTLTKTGWREAELAAEYLAKPVSYTHLTLPTNSLV